MIASNSKAFGYGRPSLREAFPKLFRHKTEAEVEKKELELIDHHEPILYKEEKILLKIFALGIPDWREWEYSYLTIGINILLALMSLDLVFRGPIFNSGEGLRFARLGFVDHHSAKVLIREPDTSALPLYVYIRPAVDTQWQSVGTVYRLGEETDYTYPLAFDKLQPDTMYAYSLSNDVRGAFKTTTAPGTEQAKSLTFLTSSCIKANFPYTPFTNSLSIHGFKHLSKALRNLPSPASFMLFLGDFIYVDVPFRLSSSQEHYRAEYRRVYASPSWKLPGLNIPWIHTLDDHEIANDWAGGNETELFVAASDPFMHYHASVNPPLPPRAPRGADTNTTYFQFSQGPASFFMMDTRRYRTAPESLTNLTSAKPLYGSPSTTRHSAEESTMLGAEQLSALLEFLQQPEDSSVHWKIVATSVPFTKNWRFGTSDTWGGFLTERSRIIEAMHFAEQNLGVRIVILSGDRHEFAAIRYPPKGNTAVADQVTSETAQSGPHEFSVGPLSMFYLPFRTFKQIDNEDVAIAYFPDGNSKFGSVHIRPAESSEREGSSILTYQLFIDGKMAWSHEIHAHQPRRSHLRTWGKMLHYS